MPMHASTVYPVLSAFKSDGDTATVKSLKLWLGDYHLEPPKVVANDNAPGIKPKQIETRIDGVKAEYLVRSLEEDEICANDPDYERETKPYSTSLHQERFERIKSGGKPPPPPLDVDAEEETIRFIDAVKMRAWLGADAEVLDMAVEPYVTLEDIGSHIGADADNAATEGRREVRDVAATFYDRAA